MSSAMQIKISFLFTVIYLITVFPVVSQSVQCDSVQLNISGYTYGNIQWQESVDGIDWSDISGADAANVYISANQNKFYRALVSSGTCSPYISDTLHYQKPTALTQAETDSIFSADQNTQFRVMQIYQHPDSTILRTVSQDIPFCDTLAIRHMMSRMLKTVILEQGVGIAAPQIGINRCAVCVLRYDKPPYNNPPFEFYLNPKILAYSDTVALRADGCLSVPTGAGYPQVIDSTYRALWVVVEYNLIDGTYKREKISHQYTAHIFQHEIDHLNGIMYFDRAGSKKLRIHISESSTKLKVKTLQK